MLTLTVEPIDIFDYENEKFVPVGFTKPVELCLEHSLISLAKWESKWKTPFLVDDMQKHTGEMLLDYVRCMTVNRVPEGVYMCLTEDHFAKIYEYMQDSMTAATFHDSHPYAATRSGEFITAETIYWWMFTFGIDKDCEKWHLNRLLALINFISIKNSKPKKMSRAEQARQQADLNRARRAKYHTKG